VKLTAEESLIVDLLRDQGIGPEELSVSNLGLMISRRALIALMRINDNPDIRQFALWLENAALGAKIPRRFKLLAHQFGIDELRRMTCKS
jgi:hypothetical protein